MKRRSLITRFVIAGIILMFPLSGVASENPQGKEEYPPVEIQKEKKVVTPPLDEQKGKTLKKGLELQGKKSVTADNMPVYRPPLRGAPGGRVGGGSRGVGDELTTLSILAPNHVGLTFQEQPTLYWYISKTTRHLIELTIIEDQAIYPLFEKGIDPPSQPGIQHIRLKEYGVHLSPKTQYRWFVALIPDPDQRSKDIIAGGIIEHVEVPEKLREKLLQADKRETIYIYAEEGIWYDALMMISDLIEASPNDTILHKQRASLLEQVGLPEIAEFEMKQVFPAGK